MADTIIDVDVRDVLTRASCAGTALRLPPEQLDRKLYERVNKALANAGGKWNKSARAHIFPSDAQPKLIAMLGSGVSVDEKKRDQAFFTPPDLARQVAELADVEGCVVLEPSAGHGALADACMAAGASAVQCFERNEEYAAILTKKYPTVIRADFLSQFPAKAMPYSSAKDGLYSSIVMNPPFTKNQDIKHVKHALKWLAEYGTLVALMMPNQKRKGFQEIVQSKDYATEIVEVERGAFKESGTDIATIIVKITKPF